MFWRIARTQLSPNELALIYAHCAQQDTTDLVHPPDHQSFRRLVETFELFEVLPPDFVLAPDVLLAFDESAFGSNRELSEMRRQAIKDRLES